MADLDSTTLRIVLGVVTFALGYMVGNRSIRTMSQRTTSPMNWVRVVFPAFLMTVYLGIIPFAVAYVWGGLWLLGLFLLLFLIGLVIGLTLMPAVRRFQFKHPNVAAVISGVWAVLYGGLHVVGAVNGVEDASLIFGVLSVIGGLLAIATGLFNLMRHAL